MGNIMVRMGVVIGILAAVQLGFLYVGRLSHPEVVEPQEPLSSFPLVVSTPETGTWEGKATELDKKIFDEAEVSVAVQRLYAKEGRSLNFFLAEYKEPSKGLYHNPMNCYRSQGFTQVGAEEKRPLTAANRPDTVINVTTWTRKNESGTETGSSPTGMKRAITRCSNAGTC